jgi:hypothetical protein
MRPKRYGKDNGGQSDSCRIGESETDRNQR